MKSTEVQTSPISRNRTLKHLPQSTEPRAVLLGSKYAMATPAQFVKQGVVTSIPRVHSSATGIKNLDRLNSALIP